jgi:hypothetical protein
VNKTANHRVRALLFFDSVAGQSLDIDGAYGAQSPDLIVAYIRWLTGTDWAWPNLPYAYQIIDHEPMEAMFDRIAPYDAYQLGDIGVFKGFGVSQFGTVGIMMRDQLQDRHLPRMVTVFTQNPGPAKQTYLSSHSISGFWRLKEALR